jgi:hypothetical protein
VRQWFLRLIVLGSPLEKLLLESPENAPGTEGSVVSLVLQPLLTADLNPRCAQSI